MPPDAPRLIAAAADPPQSEEFVVPHSWIRSFGVAGVGLGVARELYGFDTTKAAPFVRELRARPHPGRT